MKQTFVAHVLLAGALAIGGCAMDQPPQANQNLGMSRDAPLVAGVGPLAAPAMAPNANSGTVMPPQSLQAAGMASYVLVPGPVYRVLSQYDGSNADFQAVAIGDVDGDRRADLVARSGDNRIHVLRQRPDGTLMPAETFQFGVWNYSTSGDELLLADMDADGVRDIVYSASEDTGGCCGPQQGMVGIARWQGSKGWDNRLHAVNANGAGEGFGSRLVALDVDFDGNLDLVGATAIMVYLNVLTGQYEWECGVDKFYCSRMRIAFGDGRGGFSRVETVVLGLPYQFVNLAVTDLNGDGRSDLALTLLQTETGIRHVFAQYQSGYGSLMPPVALFQDTGMDAEPYEVFGDVSGDGIADVVAFTQVRTLSLAGTYSQPFFLPVWGSWHAPATVLADLDGDRRLDLVNQQLKAIPGTFVRQPVFAVYLQRAGALVASMSAVETTHHYSNHRNALAAGDLNGDKCGDVAVAGASDGAAVFYGTGCAPYTPPLPVEPGPELVP